MDLSNYKFERSFSDYQKGQLEGYYGHAKNGGLDHVQIYHDTFTDKWYLGSNKTGRPTKKEITKPASFK